MTDDLKQRLERLADRAGDGPVGLERLRAARSRKARNQRVGAGLLAVVVAVAGTVTAMTAFRDRVDDPTVPSGAAWTPPEVLTVWPENPVRGETPESVQAAVDAGDESLSWRLDPEKVAFHFARSFLAWDDPLVEEQSMGDIELIYRVDPCGARVDCPIAHLPITLRLVQPVKEGSGGIWSVASVGSSRLDIQIDPVNGVLAFGSSVDLTTDVPDYRSAHAGIVVANGCEEVFELETNIPASATLRAPVAENLDLSCGRVGAGYAFIYAMDDTTEPTGDPLLEPAAIEHPWLTIVPVYVEMQPGETTEPTTEPVPDTLEITCYGDPLTVVTPVVAAQADGVHVRVSPTDYAEIMFDKDLFRRVEGGSGEFVLSLAPGEHAVQCGLPGASQIWDPERFTVVDPNAYWVDPPPVACERAIAYTDFDLTHPDPITDENLFDTVSVAIRRNEPGEVLQLGYPDDPRFREFALVDPAGNWVASTSFTARDGSWEPDDYAYCPG